MTTLTTLARTIRSENDKLGGTVKAGLLHARKIGNALIAAQKIVNANGESWVKWVKGNCPFSYATGTRYVKVAKHFDTFTKADLADMTVPKMLDLLAGREKGPGKSKPARKVYTLADVTKAARRYKIATADLTAVLGDFGVKLDLGNKLKVAA